MNAPFTLSISSSFSISARSLSFNTILSLVAQCAVPWILSIPPILATICFDISRYSLFFPISLLLVLFCFGTGSVPMFLLYTSAFVCQHKTSLQFHFWKRFQKLISKFVYIAQKQVCQIDRSA